MGHGERTRFSGEDEIFAVEAVEGGVELTMTMKAILGYGHR
jgi:hypothetical protein